MSPVGFVGTSRSERYRSSERLSQHNVIQSENLVDELEFQRNLNQFILLVRNPLMRKKMIACASQYFRGESHMAEDVVQDAQLKAYRALGRFINGSSMVPWIFTIIRNTAMTRVRRMKRRAAQSLHDDEGDYKEELDPGEAEDPLKALADRETVTRVIEHAKKEFSDALFIVFLLHIVQGESYKQIAKDRGISLGAVRSRIHRIRDILSTSFAAELPTG